MRILYFVQFVDKFVCAGLDVILQTHKLASLRITCLVAQGQTLFAGTTCGAVMAVDMPSKGDVGKVQKVRRKLHSSQADFPYKPSNGKDTKETPFHFVVGHYRKIKKLEYSPITMTSQ